MRDFTRKISGFTRVTMLALSCALLWVPPSTHAQTPPSTTEIAAYTGLHRAAALGDAAEVETLLAKGADPHEVDRAGRTPLHVATFGSHHAALSALVAGGGDVNTLDYERYDLVTIAAVANDLPTLTLVLELGGDATLITSIYDGTALIAAAHLGHHRIVQTLIEAGAPLDHVNNLNWTALIEAVILGDGGPRHVETVRALVTAGADRTIADRDGVTPLQHAIARDYQEMIELLR
jgi:uncharacterized protein